MLKITREGKGRDLIENGFFTHRHVLPNGDNVTITIVDFRESERPMTYLNVRDVLTGIGDFMTEPGRGVSVCSYEVEVEGKGYVGTGHVDYDPEERSV